MAAQEPSGREGNKTAVSFSVDGKTAIVTGAGSGINLAFAALLLSQNCSVLIADLTLRPEAQALIEKYTPSTSASNEEHPRARALFQKTDVTHWPSLSEMFTTAIREFTHIDMLCPGAGIYDPYWSNFWHAPGVAGSSSTDNVSGGRYASLDINLTHPIRCTQLGISHFLHPPANSPVQKASPTNPKRIILISSIAGQNPNFNTPIYVAAKHGINGFIRSLAPLEERYGIRVNAVAPGVIRTPLWTEHPEKLAFLDANKDMWASAEEVADAMLRCVQEEGLRGGTVLEVGRGQTRRVEALNDPGPSGPGHTVSNLEEQYNEVYGWLEQDGWGKV